VGCGEGENAIFLAQKGFHVDAFDLSEVGIAKLKRLAAEEHVTLKAWVQDLGEYEFSPPPIMSSPRMAPCILLSLNKIT